MVKMRDHDYKLKKMPLFVRKPVNINVLRSSTPKLALLPANCYNCDFLVVICNVCAKFH